MIFVQAHQSLVVLKESRHQINLRMTQLSSNVFWSWTFVTSQMDKELLAVSCWWHQTQSCSTQTCQIRWLLNMGQKATESSHQWNLYWMLPSLTILLTCVLAPVNSPVTRTKNRKFIIQKRAPDVKLTHREKTRCWWKMKRSQNSAQEVQWTRKVTVQLSETMATRFPKHLIAILWRQLNDCMLTQRRVRRRKMRWKQKVSSWSVGKVSSTNTGLFQAKIGEPQRHFIIYSLITPNPTKLTY